MSVYVDTMQVPYRGMIMCHMLADSIEELHAMADKIGVSRRWFQTTTVPHYDICKSTCTLAIKAGAMELTTVRQVAGVMRRAREL